MEKLTDLEYLRLGKLHRFFYKLGYFFKTLPNKIGKWFQKLGRKLVKVFIAIGHFFRDLGKTFVKGSFPTKASYVIMGFGNFARGQILRGFFFLLFQVVFILYMVFTGGYWLGKFDTLGDVSSGLVYDPILDTNVLVQGDDSFKILLYGLLTILFILAFIYTWYLNIKQNRILDKIVASGKKVKSGKDDLKSLVDDQFHKTLLALPVTGIILFTVLPMIFMILVAFTNFDATHYGYSNLFTWVGLQNFNELFTLNTGSKSLSFAFGEILGWTIIWAIFATFTNYFLGLFVAIMINKKGIRLKKIWRGILVLTIAIPQFVSLLYVSKMFANNGIINGLLIRLCVIDLEHLIRFWEIPNLARAMVIIINIWIGIPYLMLMATGVLMNIPKDLYESSVIDGASTWQQFARITLPYMLFVTGPYLLTSFTNNFNNFNVIYLLTGGGPTNPDLLTSGGSAGYTDLLITWLFNITTGATSNYKLASVIGIMIFVVVSLISLIVYNLMPSNKNEEDYA